jgi:hypothetical protein
LRTQFVPDGQHVVEEQMTGYGQVDCLRSRLAPTKLSGFRDLPSMRADPSSVLKSRLPATGPRLPLKVSALSSATTNKTKKRHARNSRRHISSINDVTKLNRRTPRAKFEATASSYIERGRAHPGRYLMLRVPRIHRQLIM